MGNDCNTTLKCSGNINPILLIISRRLDVHVVANIKLVYELMQHKTFFLEWRVTQKRGALRALSKSIQAVNEYIKKEVKLDW